jgi:hypothetical protein
MHRGAPLHLLITFHARRGEAELFARRRLLLTPLHSTLIVGELRRNRS